MPICGPVYLAKSVDLRQAWCGGQAGRLDDLGELIDLRWRDVNLAQTN